ncbi:uncharacterized protein [Parasteatoda tepidariorum]|uniref:uncharacterized protein n=1 Tax=Parasteatoda tepidariorum TaxID=114398 RepID=UPI0039BC68A5
MDLHVHLPELTPNYRRYVQDISREEGLTDKVASFAEKFITNELLKSGKLEELNQTVGDDLKAGVQEAKDGLQELGKAINAGLQKLAESAEKASAAKSAPGPSAKAVPAVIAAPAPAAKAA